MRKLKLDVDALRIESFATGSGSGAGTVKGHGPTDCSTCANDSFYMVITCGQAYTCQATCDGLANTCNGTATCDGAGATCDLICHNTNMTCETYRAFTCQGYTCISCAAQGTECVSGVNC